MTAKSQLFSENASDLYRRVKCPLIAINFGSKREVDP